MNIEFKTLAKPTHKNIGSPLAVWQDGKQIGEIFVSHILILCKGEEKPIAFRTVSQLYRHLGQ